MRWLTRGDYESWGVSLVLCRLFLVHLLWDPNADIKSQPLQTAKRYGLYIHYIKKLSMDELKNNLKKDNTYLIDFENLVDIGRELSYQFEGVNAPTRSLQLSTITLAKIIDGSVSLLRLLPSSILADKRNDYIDFPSIASLYRDLIEACNHSWYLSFERISNIENDLRLAIYDYHDTFELLKIFNYLGLAESEIDYLKNQLSEFRNRIECNTVFLTLDKQKQKQILQGKQGALYTQFEIAERRNLNLDKFKGIYKLLSNQTHTTASSLKTLTFSKIHDKENAFQILMTLIIIEYFNRFLASTILNTGKVWQIKFAREDSEKLVRKYSGKLRFK